VMEILSFCENMYNFASVNLHVFLRSFYTEIKIHLLMDDGTLGPEKVVNGYNGNAKINFVGW